MLATMSRYWWVFLVRGILSIIFGVIAILAPGITLVSLVLVFGIYAIIDGASTVFAGFQSRETDERWWWSVIEGVVSVIAGIVAIIWPVIAGITLLLVIGVWAILTGIMQIAAAIRLRKEIDNEWWLGLSGALSILFGVFVILFPGAGGLAVLWLIGFYAIIFGVLFILLAFRLRGRDETSSQSRQAA